MSVSSLHVGHIDLAPLEQKKLIVDSLPATDLLHDGSIVGNYSYRVTGMDGDGRASILNDDGYTTTYPIRIISSRHTRVMPHTHIRDTETAFTRCFLKSLPRVIARRKEVDGRRAARPPQYCQPTVSNVDTFYVDLVSAYQSIYERLSWRVRYLRGKYFSNDDDKLVYPFPNEWKSGRSYVVTGALPRSVHFIRDHKVVVSNAYNDNENPCLVAAVWDVLSAVARFAIDVYQSRYFNLDGAVVPISTFDGYCNFLDSLGLKYRTKYQGKAHILNLAVWQIGEHVTKRYGTMNMPVKTDAVPVTLAEAQWILDRFIRM